MPKHIFLNASFFLLFFVSFTLIDSNVAFIFGFDLNILNVLIGFLFSILLLSYIEKDRLNVLISVSLAVVIIIIAYHIAINYFDTSWDGQGYHQETIYLLKNGWNPIYENSNAFRMWVNLYQKGNEILQANIYLITDKIESAKLLNILLIYIAFFVFWSFLDTLKIKNIFKLILSFIVVFNPVVFSQIFTYYIDGNWYLTLLISLSSLITYFSDKKLQYIIIFVLSSVVFCSLKFSSIPIFIVFSFFAIFYHYFVEKKMMIIPFLSTFVLGLICNMHPFITNLKNGKHLLHPFAGDSKIDIINQNIPELLLNKNRVERLLISLFSKTSNDIKNVELYDMLKFPFTFTKQEFFINYDTRLGGFGFLFSGVIVITVLLMFFIIFKRNEVDKKIIVAIASAFLVSVMVNPACWWSRLSAQIWLIPIIFVIFGLISTNRKTIFLSQITIGLLLINILISVSITALKFQQDNKTVNDFISKVGDKTITLDLYNQYGFQQYYLKFKERNIKYKIEKIKNKNQLAPFTPDVYYKIE